MSADLPYHLQSPAGNPGGSGSGNNSEFNFSDISTTSTVAVVSFWDIIIGVGEAEIV